MPAELLPERGPRDEGGPLRLDAPQRCSPCACRTDVAAPPIAVVALVRLGVRRGWNRKISPRRRIRGPFSGVCGADEACGASLNKVQRLASRPMAPCRPSAHPARPRHVAGQAFPGNDRTASCSTVVRRNSFTLFARFLGWSMSLPIITAASVIILIIPVIIAI